VLLLLLLLLLTELHLCRRLLHLRLRGRLRGGLRHDLVKSVQDVAQLHLDLHRVLLEVLLEFVQVLLQSRHVRLEHRVVMPRPLRRVVRRGDRARRLVAVKSIQAVVVLVLFGLVAALNLPQVSHAITCELGVLELHRAIAAGSVRHALEAVDVQLPNEGPQVVMLEVEWQDILRGRWTGGRARAHRSDVHTYEHARPDTDPVAQSSTLGWRWLVHLRKLCAVDDSERVAVLGPADEVVGRRR
jgi:hypothetical protein